MKAVMLSIQPKWCELIASGKKTVEVRKTKPKLETPFKCYIYCTQNTPYNPLIPMKYEKEGGNIYIGGKRYAEFLTSRVIGEFVCDKVDGFTYFENCVIPQMVNVGIEGRLTLDELAKYFKGNSDGYAWHISNLVIYDKPKELSEFKQIKIIRGYHKEGETKIEKLLKGSRIEVKYLTRPPQSWCYCEELKGD